MGEILWIANAQQINNVSQRCNGAEFDVNNFPALYNMMGNTFGGIPGSTTATPIIEPLDGGANVIQPQIIIRGFYLTSENLGRLNTKWTITTTIANNNNPPNQ